MEENRRWLRERFLERLLALEPRSLVDVGCGAGELVAGCRSAGVPAAGIEASAQAARCARAAGTPVVRADAAALPLAARSVEWVTLRHVPHHLPTPATALAEAWRVARCGVLLGEPWYDDTRPDQRAGRRADRWLKRMDRRRGRFHADVLAAGELLALLPAPPARSEVAVLCADRSWRPRDLETERARSCAGATVPPEEEEEWRALLAVSARGAVGLSGTVVVTAWKPDD